MADREHFVLFRPAGTLIGRAANDGQYRFFLFIPRPPLGAWFLLPEHWWVLGAAVLLCYWLAYHFSSPVKQMQRAVERFGAHATGITLSQNQYEYVTERIRAAGLQDRANVQLRDYRDLPGTQVYDKIASVGMFEHVGLKNLPAYFGKIHSLLKDDGLFLNHGITTSDPKSGRMELGAGEFIDRYTIRVKLKEPDYILFGYLCSSPMAAVAREVIERYGDGNGWTMDHPVGCFFLKNALKNSGVIGVSMPAYRIYFFAALMFSITLSEQFEAPRLKRISSRPASPNAFKFSSVANVPFVYRC
jgi:hypothetical protein